MATLTAHCHHSGQQEINENNTYIQEDPQQPGHFNIFFKCPCGCGETMITAVPIPNFEIYKEYKILLGEARDNSIA